MGSLEANESVHKMLGGHGGGDNTYMCFAEVTSVLLKLKTSHWCFLVFTLISEFGFWHCRHFRTLIFSIFLDFSDSFLPKALIPQEKLSMDSAAGMPSCHSEDPWEISRLEVRDLLCSRTYKAVTSLTSFVLASTGRPLNTGPHSTFCQQSFVGPSLLQLFQNHLINSWSTEAVVKSLVYQRQTDLFSLFLCFPSLGLGCSKLLEILFSPLSFYLAPQSTPLTTLT